LDYGSYETEVFAKVIWGAQCRKSARWVQASRETFAYDDARIVALAEAGAVGTCETPTVVVRDARHNSSHLRDNEPAIHKDAL
jgi:hypothetical protein